MISLATMGWLVIALSVATLLALMVELLRHTICYLHGLAIPAMPMACLYLTRATVICLPVALWVLG
ncbi:hypothetical protein [Albibacillus kandeliae]|uniref:hypothetical protein n=1 Tax=Albibacillus kandeliae TaxID=2174228 RepID=UPI000D699BA9|nr:hypothetical protein [Albibacillus kandeliae]